MQWMLAANSKHYDYGSSFQDFGFIYWQQTVDFKVGDIVYIYSTEPKNKLSYVTRVEKVNVNFEKICDDKKYWTNEELLKKDKEKGFARLRLISNVEKHNVTYERLVENGLKQIPEKPIKVKDKLLTYIENKVFDSF